MKRDIERLTAADMLRATPGDRFLLHTTATDLPAVAPGTQVEYVRAITTPDADHDEEVLPMFVVRVPDDNSHPFEVWADELRKPEAESRAEGEPDWTPEQEARDRAEG